MVCGSPHLEPITGTWDIASRQLKTYKPGGSLIDMMMSTHYIVDKMKFKLSPFEEKREKKRKKK